MSPEILHKLPQSCESLAETGLEKPARLVRCKHISGSFLCEKDWHSGFHDLVRRMLGEHKLIARRKQLDFCGNLRLFPVFLQRRRAEAFLT